jgi:signal transduction histidine kinase
VRWLEEKLGTAAALAIVLVEEDSSSLSRQVQDEVLMAIGARAIAVRDDGVARLLVVADMPPEVDEHLDLGETGMFSEMSAALDTLIFGGDRMLRVFGEVGDSSKEFEIVLPDRKLRVAMLGFSRNVAMLALLISLSTAMLVYLTIDRIMIRPIRAMTRSMLDFGRRPDDPSRIIRPSRRDDEIGVAQRELAGMQAELQKTLGEQKHLADLGLAVSKINHDLRNLLASSQLLSDQLASVPDPRVQRFAPKLLRSLERAIAFCQSTLSYGKVQEARPERRMVALEPVVNEVRESAGIATDPDIVWSNAIERGLVVDADPDQLFRVLLNLVRNAFQALEGQPHADIAPKQIRVAGRREGAVAVLEISDTGPGIPEQARAHLFEAFQGSSRDGGTGLGLAIAAELIKAHGGQIDLVEGTIGATFRIVIPDRTIPLRQLRQERSRA